MGLEPLDELFHGAWSADPEQRPASAGDFAARFARALESVPSTLLTSRRTVREGVLRAYAYRDGRFVDVQAMARLRGIP